MKTVPILLLFSLVGFSGFAQVKDAKPVFAVTDVPNSFIIGDDSVVYYIQQNYRVCEGIPEPQTAVMSMVVEPDGSTTELKVVSEILPVLKERIFEMFKTFPKWKPGYINDKPVRSVRLLLFKCAEGEVILPPYKTPEW